MPHTAEYFRCRQTVAKPGVVHHLVAPAHELLAERKPDFLDGTAALRRHGEEGSLHNRDFHSEVRRRFNPQALRTAMARAIQFPGTGLRGDRACSRATTVSPGVFHVARTRCD